MKKLGAVLKKESQQEIENFSLKFGFDNVRILKPFSDSFEQGKLYLVVDEKKEEKQYPAALEAMLKENLQCKVEIIVSDNIKEFYKEEVLTNCAEISNKEKVDLLFMDALNEIEFEEFIIDPLFIRAKGLADRIIKEKTEAMSYLPAEEGDNVTSQSKRKSDLDLEISASPFKKPTPPLSPIATPMKLSSSSSSSLFPGSPVASSPPSVVNLSVSSSPLTPHAIELCHALSEELGVDQDKLHRVIEEFKKQSMDQRHLGVTAGGQ